MLVTKPMHPSLLYVCRAGGVSLQCLAHLLLASLVVMSVHRVTGKGCRVEPEVTLRPPHRSGRAPFEHPVLHASLCCPGNFRFRNPLELGDTVGELEVSPVVASQWSVMRGVAFPKVGPLGLGSPLSRPAYLPPTIGTILG